MGKAMAIMGLTSLGPICLLGAAGAEGKGLIITENGKAKATIVVSAEKNEKVMLAATDLQNYIQKMSGTRLPLVTDSQSPKGSLILVGRSKLTDRMNVSIPSGLTGARREDGFTIVCKGSRLVLAGNDAGPYHGTEYAVSDFLNRLGVRWYMPGEYGEYVPKQATISFPEIQVTEKPDFIMRNWWMHEPKEMAEQQRAWKIHNKMTPDELFAIPHDGSMSRILPPNRFFKDHPEYFAMNPDGTRNPNLPNMSNPDTIKACAQVIGEKFRENPDANSISFAPDDGYPRDYDKASAKLNAGFVELGGRPGVPAEVSISEEWFTFCNNLCAEVHKEFPDVYLSTNAYANRDFPPVSVKPDDHLIIMFADIMTCSRHAYDDPRCWMKTGEGRMLKQWGEISRNVWVYNYTEQMLVSALTPVPEVHKLRREMPLAKSWGIIGFWDEARNCWAESGIMSKYLRAKLEWDADADVDALMDDFYAHWYGKAAAPMHAFYEAIEDQFDRTNIHGHEDRILPEVYTPDLMATLAKHLADAERLADDERSKLHVKADRLIYQHLQGYVALSDAEAAGDFAEASRQAGRMLEVRKELHVINPFYVWPDENTKDWYAGTGYWTVTQRREYYQGLADRTSGKTGDLIAMLSDTAMFRTDPHDDGLFAGWYKPEISQDGWSPILTTRPFYVQGYQDDQGHPYVGCLWYRMDVDVPASAAGKKVVLYAPVLESEGWCWVNGQYVGHRRYLDGYNRPQPMEFDVTSAIKPGEKNVIAIRVYTGIAPAQAMSGLLSRVFLYSPKSEMQ